MVIGGVIALASTTAILAMWLRPVRETSLLGCWVWTAVAVIALAAGLCLEGLERDSAPLRLILNTAIFCPTISLFGARKPQHRGWNFIVLTLWGVLALPAADAVFLQGSDQIQLHGARLVFMTMVILASLGNHLFTRQARAATLFCLGQTALLAEFYVQGGDFTHWRLVAAFLIAAAGWTAWWTARRPRTETGWNRVWLDFRDLFGAIWGLRLMERLNAAARISDWPIRLNWRKLRVPAAVPAEVMAGMETCLRAYLRRFVSDRWIERRLDGRENRDA